MFMILRTLFGLVVGWIASAFFALLGRHNQGSLTVRPDRRQFVRNAALGAVGSVLALMGAAIDRGLRVPADLALVGVDDAVPDQVCRAVSERYAVPRASVAVLAVDSAPRTVSGKVDRPALASHFGRAPRSGHAPAVGGPPEKTGAGHESGELVDEVRALYAVVLDRPDATADDSFVSLRGDSLSYVEMSVRLEGLLGTLPTSWHVRSIADLVGDLVADRAAAPSSASAWARSSCGST